MTAIDVAKCQVDYTVLAPLSDEKARTHDVSIEAADLTGNLTMKEIGNLKVTYNTGQIVGQVVVYPEKVRAGAPVKLAYNLSSDVDVSLYIYSISGMVEITGKYPAGTNGGQAGYNEVDLQTVSGISKLPLGNGIYIIQLAIGGKLAGTSHLVIND